MVDRDASQSVQIEAGSLASLDPERVVQVLVCLRENAYQCEKMAGLYGGVAVESKARGWHAAAEHSAQIAARYGHIALAYKDALAWIMCATAQTSFALAMPPLEPTETPERAE